MTCRDGFSDFQVCRIRPQAILPCSRLRPSAALVVLSGCPSVAIRTKIVWVGAGAINTDRQRRHSKTPDKITMRHFTSQRHTGPRVGGVKSPIICGTVTPHDPVGKTAQIENCDSRTTTKETFTAEQSLHRGTDSNLEKLDARPLIRKIGTTSYDVTLTPQGGLLRRGQLQLSNLEGLNICTATKGDYG